MIERMVASSLCNTRDSHVNACDVIITIVNSVGGGPMDGIDRRYCINSSVHHHVVIFEETKKNEEGPIS